MDFTAVDCTTEMMRAKGGRRSVVRYDWGQHDEEMPEGEFYPLCCGDRW